MKVNEQEGMGRGIDYESIKLIYLPEPIPANYATATVQLLSNNMKYEWYS